MLFSYKNVNYEVLYVREGDRTVIFTEVNDDETIFVTFYFGEPDEKTSIFFIEQDYLSKEGK